MSEMTLKHIRKFVESHARLTLDKNTRQRPYIEARSVYYRLCRDFTESSYQEISKSVGLTHASIIHSLDKVFPTLHIYNKKMASIYDKFSAIFTSQEEAAKTITIMEENELLRDKLYNERLKRRETDKRLSSIEGMVKGLDQMELEKVAEKISVFVKVIEAQRHMSK